MSDLPIVLFDLDGTLCDPEHRRHFIAGNDAKSKDWLSFHMHAAYDPPVGPIVNLYKLLNRALMAEFWITSGRSDVARAITEDWLARHGIEYDNLLMREEGDHRPDFLVKRELITPVADRILWVFDDRDSVVGMWRGMGLTCLQVGPGNF